MRNAKMWLICLFLSIWMINGCSVAPKSVESKDVLSTEVKEAISIMKIKDPDIQQFFDKSYGYAVLPKIFKGAFIAGGAYGRGEVFEKGEMIGYCDMSQATLGFSFGGEYFREIVFFRDKMDIDNFKTGEYTFAAEVSGVALTAGAAAKADYKAGMAVFIATDAGLMVDASLGGQEFKYVPAATSK
jgi:lipid-binding SYLF domain-containing protein